MYEVITIGSNTLDVFAKTDSELIEIKTKNSTEELLAYPLGGKILINELDFMIGGGGTNTAVALTRLGIETAYLGKIGKDENGLKIYKTLREEGIDFLGTLGNISGYSVILDSIEEDRTILTYKGCNDQLTYEEINFDNIKAEWFYFASMMGKSFETLKKLAEYASKNNIKVAFNASSYMAAKGFSELKPILENTTILVLNKEEAELIAGKGEIKDMLERLKLPNMEEVIITNGSDGAYCFNGESIYHIKPQAHLIIKETTGAGDAFASTFVAGRIMKKDIEESLRMAIINAESVIQNYGAKNILLTEELLLRKLVNDNREVECEFISEHHDRKNREEAVKNNDTIRELREAVAEAQTYIKPIEKPQTNKPDIDPESMIPEEKKEPEEIELADENQQPEDILDIQKNIEELKDIEEEKELEPAESIDWTQDAGEIATIIEEKEPFKEEISSEEIEKEPKPKKEEPEEIWDDEKVLQERKEYYAKLIIDPTKHFYLKCGHTLISLDDFIAKLPLIPYNCFEYHTQKEYNDFARWINHVFHDEELAERLKGIKDKHEMIEVLKKYKNCE